jgi:hypothetical protein
MQDYNMSGLSRLRWIPAPPQAFPQVKDKVDYYRNVGVLVYLFILAERLGF